MLPQGKVKKCTCCVIPEGDRGVAKHKTEE